MGLTSTTNILSSDIFLKTDGPSLFTQIENLAPQKIFNDYYIFHEKIYSDGPYVYSNQPYKDKCIIHSFMGVDSQNEESIIKWVRKYGLLKNEPELSLEDFRMYHKIVKELFEIICAISAWVNGNSKLLNKQVQLFRLGDFMTKLLRDNPSKIRGDMIMIKRYGDSMEELLSIDIPPIYRNNWAILFNGALAGFYSDDIPQKKDLLPILTIKAITRVLNGIIMKGQITYYDDVIYQESDILPFRIKYKIKCNDLVTMICYRLLWLIMADNGLKKCNKCGAPFIPNDNEGKRPGKQIYCDSCGAYARQNRYKEDMRNALKDYKQGLSPEVIAQKMNREIDQVKRWISKI